MAGSGTCLISKLGVCVEVVGGKVLPEDGWPTLSFNGERSSSVDVCGRSGRRGVSVDDLSELSELLLPLLAPFESPTRSSVVGRCPRSVVTPPDLSSAIAGITASINNAATAAIMYLPNFPTGRFMSPRFPYPQRYDNRIRSILHNPRNETWLPRVLTIVVTIGAVDFGTYAVTSPRSVLQAVNQPPAKV